MTNWEKFKEIFGIPDIIEPIGEICDIVSCSYFSCRDCIFGHDKDFWSEEYKEEIDDTNN